MLLHEDQVDVSYRNLIEEAYISPIRSAVLVDDDFPTLEDLVNGNSYDKDGAEKLKTLLNACRHEPNQWLVDVHNGKNIKKSSKAEDYRHLHHSDLMVLDYHLDGSAGGNDKALSILRTLATNDYYNIVVVYTACYDQDDLESRMRDIVCGLAFQPEVLKSPSIPEKILEIESGENEMYYDEDFGDKLKGVFKLISPIFLFEGQSDIESKWIGSNHFSQIQSELSKMNVKKKSDQKEIMTWLWNDRLYTENEFSKTDLGAITYSNPADADKGNWIKSDRLFVTIIEKDTHPSAIRDKLLDSLAASNPSPYQLLMAKMRNCLDEKGFIAESAIVRKENIQAGLMWKIISAKEEMWIWELRQTIGYHWEQLSTEVEEDVHSFGEKIFRYIREENDEGDKPYKSIKKYTSKLLNEKHEFDAVNKEFNSFACSKRPNGIHLMPGQIFTFRGDKHDRIGGVESEQDSYWMCFSPACDLVPGRESKKRNWPEPTHKIMPFMAVKLVERTVNDSLKKINDNDYMFIDVSGVVRCFAFGAEDNSNPIAEQYYALDGGIISDGGIKISVIKKFDPETGEMENHTLCAKIIGQLRYEYAVNIIQKVVAKLSRIGLDFIYIKK